jgi:hypothetical protein
MSAIQALAELCQPLSTADILTGQRFLLIGPPQDPGPPLTVVLNWTAALKK